MCRRRVKSRCQDQQLAFLLNKIYQMHVLISIFILNLIKTGFFLSNNEIITCNQFTNQLAGINFFLRERLRNCHAEFSDVFDNANCHHKQKWYEVVWFLLFMKGKGEKTMRLKLQ